MHKYQPVLELLRKKSVAQIKDVFKKESEKGINFTSFYDILKSKLELDVEEKDVKHLYFQIDCYCKESITITEITTYLDHYVKKRSLLPEAPFETTPTMYPGVRCQDSIIEWVLYPEDPDVKNEIAGHYLSLSRSGILCVWTQDMKKTFETTIEVAGDAVLGKTTVWATSITCLPKEKLLAVATTSGDIRFFHASTYKFGHRFSIVHFPSIVLALHCFSSKKLIYGDFLGNVSIIYMGKAFFTRNHRRASHLPQEKVPIDYIKMGKVTGMSLEGTSKSHFSPVQQVEYIPSLEAVICCSVSTSRAMLIHFTANNRSLSFTSPGGIHCFAFCKRLGCIATGCVDHSLKIWNPIMNTSCNETLTGHTSSVNHVLLDENRMCLISCDRDKTFRVWDLLRPKCLQVIKFKETEFPGKQTFSSVFLDSSSGDVILTTYRIGQLRRRHTGIRQKAHPTSEYLILAFYSSIFDCLVTVGNAFPITVWDNKSGSLIYEFGKIHKFVDFEDDFPQNITAAGLVSSERRLVTADRIGEIKVWNFHLGLCLQCFQTNFTVLSLCFAEFHIYAAGSSGFIMNFYDNGYETMEAKSWAKQHKKAVISIDIYRQNLLVSASIDGEIVIWIRKSSEAKFHLIDLKATKEDGKGDYFAECERRRVCSISQVLFLQTRNIGFNVGNLVSCGMDGRIRFWNIVYKGKLHEGKLLSKFRGVFRNGDGILCIATDADNRYLLTGDTMGYLRVYELDDYYSVYGSSPRRIGDASTEQLIAFPFLRLQQIINKKHSELSKFPKDGGSEMGCAPFLLNCFRAHSGAILKVNYMNEKDLLVTAGREGSVRLWSISGAYVGQLGHEYEPWSLSVKKRQSRALPCDIKAVASAVSLFVTNNGNIPYWERALESLKWCRLGHQPEDVTKNPLTRPLRKSLSFEGMDKYGSLENELEKRLPKFQRIRACKSKLFELMEDEI